MPKAAYYIKETLIPEDTNPYCHYWKVDVDGGIAQITHAGFGQAKRKGAKWVQKIRVVDGWIFDQFQPDFGLIFAYPGKNPLQDERDQRVEENRARRLPASIEPEEPVEIPTCSKCGEYLWNCKCSQIPAVDPSTMQDILKISAELAKENFPAPGLVTPEIPDQAGSYPGQKYADGALVQVLIDGTWYDGDVAWYEPDTYLYQVNYRTDDDLKGALVSEDRIRHVPLESDEEWEAAGALQEARLVPTQRDLIGQALETPPEPALPWKAQRKIDRAALRLAAGDQTTLFPGHATQDLPPFIPEGTDVLVEWEGVWKPGKVRSAWPNCAHVKMANGRIAHITPGQDMGSLPWRKVES